VILIKLIGVLNMKMQKRNFGFGRSIKYAAKQALKFLKGERYSTIASHCHRFNLFADFCNKHSTSNAIYITLEHFEFYVSSLQNKVVRGDLSTSYAHNLVSSINVVMYAFRRDSNIWLSPKTLFGPRCHIRQIAPCTSYLKVRLACRKIEELAGNDIAILVWLARTLGLRLKEAILLDATLALKQAITMGHVDVRKGTKGGRGKKVQRLVPVNKRILFTLKIAVIAQGHRNSFIPENEKLITFYRRIHRIALPILKEFSVNKIHDLRAAYTCDRYEDVLGIQAPVITGVSPVKTDDLIEGKRKISLELGHVREYVIDSYCGS